MNAKLEEDAIRFDTFLRKTTSAYDAVKEAEAATKKNDKVQEIKRLNQQRRPSREMSKQGKLWTTA